MKSSKTKLNPENYFDKSYDLFLTKQFPEVIHLCKKSLKLDPKFRPAYLRLGNVFSILHRFDEASDYYNRFLRYSLESEDQFDISKAYNAIGYLHILKREVKDALKYFYLTLDILKTLNKPKEIARSFNNIALAYRIDNNFEKSLSFYQKALEISKKNNHLDRTAYYYFNLAIMFKEQKKYFKASWYMRKFIKLDKVLKKKGFYLSPKDQGISALE